MWNDLRDYLAEDLKLSFRVWGRGQGVTALVLAAVVVLAAIVGVAWGWLESPTKGLSIGLMAFFGLLLCVVSPFRMWRRARREVCALQDRRKLGAILDAISLRRTEGVELLNEPWDSGLDPESWTDQWTQRYTAWLASAADDVAKLSLIEKRRLTHIGTIPAEFRAHGGLTPGHAHGKRTLAAKIDVLDQIVARHEQDSLPMASATPPATTAPGVEMGRLSPTQRGWLTLIAVAIVTVGITLLATIEAVDRWARFLGLILFLALLAVAIIGGFGGPLVHGLRALLRHITRRFTLGG